MAGGTPAFPASRVLGARASRSHGGKNALLGNASSRHARKKTYPFKGRLGGGHFEKPTHRHLPTAQPKFTIPPSLRFPPLCEGNRRGLVPPASRGNPEGGGRQLPFFVNFGSAIGITSPVHGGGFPPCVRGGSGWGRLYRNLYAKTLIIIRPPSPIPPLGC